MPTFTPNKGYPVPTVSGDENLWGTELNDGLAILDNNMGGVAAVNVAGGSNVTATAVQAQQLIQRLTGAITANIQYILPAVGSFYIIDNESTGAFSITVVTSATGSVGTVVPQGTGLAVYSDGVNVYPCTGSYANALTVPNATITGTLGVNIVDVTTSITGGTLTITGTLTAGSEIVSGTSTSGSYTASAGVISTGFDAGGMQFRTTFGNYGAGIRNDGGTCYFLQTASGSPNGVYNGFRPFYWNLSNGAVVVDGTAAGTTFGGNVQVNESIGVNGNCTVNGAGYFGSSVNFCRGIGSGGGFYCTYSGGNNIFNVSPNNYIYAGAGGGGNLNYVTGGTHEFAGNVNTNGWYYINGTAVVANNGGTYAINITGSSQGAPWGGISGVPALCYNNGGTYGINISGTATYANNCGGNFTVSGYISTFGGVTVSTGGYYIDQGGSSYGATVGAGIIINNNQWLMTYGVACYSDGRLKTDVEDITQEQGVDWIKRGRPRRYTHLNGRRSVGFIAQEEVQANRHECLEIAEHDHELVEKGDGIISDGHVFLRDYNHDIPYLTAALQAALARIEQLEAKLAA